MTEPLAPPARYVSAVSLGDYCSDAVTGFSGTVVQITFRLHSGTLACLERADKDGLPRQQWFDEPRLKVLAEPAPGGTYA